MINNRNPDKYCADEGNKWKCDRTDIGQWEKFTITQVSGSIYSIKGGKNSKYCSDEDEDNTIKCNRDTVTQKETFAIANYVLAVLMY